MTSRRGISTAYIQKLEQLCLAHPQSADVRTMLGMAHAVNLDVYKSMDALEEARAVEPENFWAQLKYAELHYRLRALNNAEEETRRAARPGGESAAARARAEANAGDPHAEAQLRAECALDQTADGPGAVVLGRHRRHVRRDAVEVREVES